MSLWHPSPPQGFSSGQGQVIIGRPMTVLIGAPQGIVDNPVAAGFALVQTQTLDALVQTDTLDALIQGGS